MAEFPALQLWTDAYLGDTTHLTTIEHGAYLLLLMAAWRTREVSLPDDDKLLARYARCTLGQWKRIRPILEPFYKIENGTWVQSRLTDEANAVRQKRESQVANGRASALKRKGRHAAKRDENSNQARTPTATANTLAKANAVPPDEILFSSGVQILVSGGRTEPQARSVIGRWKRDHGSEAVLVALGKAQREGAIDPVSFCEGVLRHRRREEAECDSPIV